MSRRHFFLLWLLPAVAAASAGTWMARAIWLGARTEFPIGRPREIATAAINFGKVYYGERATRELTVVNASKHHLTLGEKTGCGCTQVRILVPTLPPGGRSAVRVSYSGIDPARTGPASQEFLIFNTGKTLITELHGVVRAFLSQSLHFNRTEVSWRYLSGEPAHGGQTVVAENVSGAPISVEWSARGVGRFFSVVPDAGVIAPGASEKFLFRPSAAMAADRRPEAEAIVLRGTLQSKGKPIPLDFKFDAYATPEPILEAIPGALVLSRSPDVRSISKIVRLIAGPGIGKPPRVLALTTSSHALHAALKDGSIVVLLHLTAGQALFQGDIHVAYLYDGVKSTLDIPVFAAPDIVGH